MTKQQASEGKRSWTHRADNRQRLVEAGYEVLSEKGFEAATVKEISRVAGVSPGLFHYYFASKDELLLAVFEESDRRFKERLVLRQAHARGTTQQDYVEASVKFIYEIVLQEPQLFRLHYELYALGLRNPDFLPVVGGQLANVRSSIAQTLRELYADLDEARAQALSAVILACFDGLALQRLAQPEAELTPAYDLLGKLLEAELTPARNRQARAP